ncbi:MAG: L1 protein [Melanogrammus aeglefinus-associated papillomavirus 2]|uniref:Major capsid protein L1 n=1 Tax=Papillomaviridae sp. TaxID=2052558 RepID=A0A8F5XVW6_9PAPI|nr:MAG: L1 protein [Melanogrammus aeglefinus-associated papillomavirus 2]
MFNSRGKIPVAVPYSEGGNLTEPYIKSTDEYVKESDITYVVQSENIRLEGHPFKKVDDKTPFVSPSRFNVVGLDLPDMNKLYLPPMAGNIGLDSEIAVWKIVGLRVDSQGPLQPATTGQRASAAIPSDSGAKNADLNDGPPDSPYNNHLPNFTESEAGDDPVDANVTVTYSWGMEHKQVQLLCVGCEPALGVHEAKVDPTALDAAAWAGDIKRVTSDIADGDLHEFGYGNIDYNNCCKDLSLLPIEMCYNNGPTKILDKLTMDNDKTGNKCFFCWEKTGAGVRHSRLTEGLKFSEDGTHQTQRIPQQQNVITSGMISSAGDLFNKNYWLNKAKGPNNGVLWDNKLYITFVDNTRGYIHQLSSVSASADGNPLHYDPTKTSCFLRHVREFKITVLVRLCHVKLEAKLITWLMQYNANWLKNIGFNFSYGQGEPVVGFREVLQPQLGLLGEKEEENERDFHCIKVDCSGHASLVQSHQSHHPLALSYHSAVGYSEAPPVKKAAKRAAPKPRGGAK